MAVMKLNLSRIELPIQKELCEQVVNRLTQEIQKQAGEEKLFVLEENLDPEDSHIVLANYLAECPRQSFRARPVTERINRQLEPTNRIINLLMLRTHWRLED